MIVRTYARRHRCITRSYSDSGFNGVVEDTFQESVSQESSQEIYGYTAFSSQDSSPWSLDSDLYSPSTDPSFVRETDSFSLLPPRPSGNSCKGNDGVRKSKKARNLPKESKNPNSSILRSISVPATSTLMEAQEFGEMMEHVDEVNFALDGLRPGQPARIRRASLLSLLSICMTSQQRRLLRTKGMAKIIIDALLGLTFDDPPSTLAASALFYVLGSDGQDDHLLDSSPCIHFLLKLLDPPTPVTIDDKAPSLGTKNLSVRSDPCTSRTVIKRLDSSSTSVISKVQEILLSCKEIKPWNTGDDGIGSPELSSKWISLLTMEKACLSTVSLEDTSGTVRRVGGNFKERLRELGGLDAVFNVAASCHSIMEGWVKHSVTPFREFKDGVDSESVPLLLKSLKIMENATFLSKDNQNHLLGLKEKSNCAGSALSFVGLIISAIKILSGLFLHHVSSGIGKNEASVNLFGGKDTQLCRVPVVQSKDEKKGGRDQFLIDNSSGKRCNTMGLSHVNGSKACKKHQRFSNSQTVINVSSSETTTTSGSDVYSTSGSDVYSITKRVNSLTPISCNIRGPKAEISPFPNMSKMDSFGLSKAPVHRDIKLESLEDSQDPFAFDEDDLKPSKWDLLSKRKAPSETHQSRVTARKPENGWELELATGNDESSNEENCYPCETSCFSVVEEEEDLNLLGDCLLTAVKVLINLTNDNPVGCQQIAACGGLDTMSALIIDHFPFFNSSLSADSQMKEVSFSESRCSSHQGEQHLSDHELDFLVAIMGLLVNLVEKDDRNRSLLAAGSVPLPTSGGSEKEESCRGVVPLLCSIFLANRGAGEAAEEGKLLLWNDEAAVLQGEQEAEKMIVEAYSALLLAFLSTESLDVRKNIAGCLPDHSLEVLVPVLERFVAFHLTLNMISPETHATVSEVIESCRRR